MLPNIVGKPTREAVINIHRLLISNAASVAFSLRGVGGGGCGVWGGRYGNLALTMATEDYLSQTGHTFAPPQNPVNYPPNLGTAQ